MKKRLFAVAMSFGNGSFYAAWIGSRVRCPGILCRTRATVLRLAMVSLIPPPAFPELVAEQNDFSLTNLAEDGATSADLLATVQDPANLAAISGADIVTVTIGGNDLMSALYEFLAAQGIRHLTPR